MAARGCVATKEVGVFRDSSGSGPERDPDRSSDGTSAPWPALVGFVGLSLLLGAANAAAIPASSQSWLLALLRPPGTLPAGLLAPAWAALSLPSGFGAWLAWRRPGHRGALLLWGWHLLACAAWMQCFLGWRLPAPALAASLVLVLLAGLAAAAFARLRAAAGALLLPTLVWTCYGAYVTAGIWWLNRG